MQELADGVYILDGFPKYAVNVYLLGDVLIDAGLVIDKGRILKQITGMKLTAHSLTHAHLDHYGASKAVTTTFGIPMSCGALDVDAVQSGKMLGPFGLMMPAAPAVHVDRALAEGDELAGFIVLDTPGHSPGHVSYWRESDRTLVCGDVMWGQNPFLMRGGIMEPFPAVSPDPKLNRASARRLAELQPALVCFGHGAPCRDTGAFSAAVAKLPVDGGLT
jgi:glyoxylase-like metal-dependent hydrolase (beta-lactamase superfamily II)